MPANNAGFDKDAQRMADAVKKLVEPFQQLEGILNRVQGRMQGFVQAGIQSTAYAKILDFEMGELSRQLAAVFLPVVEQVIDGVRRLTDFFRGLTGSQQEHIRKWAELAIGVGVFIAILPKLEAGFKWAMRSMATEGALMETLLTGGIVVALGAVVAAVGEFFTNTEAGKSVLAGLLSGLNRVWSALQPLINAFGEIYEQVQLHVNDAFEELGRIGNDVLSEIADAVKMIVPYIQSFAHEVAPLIGMFAELLTYISATPFIVLAGAIMLIVQAGKALKDTFADMLASLKAFVMQIAPLAAAVQWFEEMNERNRKKKKEDDKKRNDVGRDPGNFEDVGALYKRIRQMSEKGESGKEEKKPEDVQSDLLQQIRMWLDTFEETYVIPVKGWVSDILDKLNNIRWPWD